MHWPEKSSLYFYAIISFKYSRLLFSVQALTKSKFYPLFFLFIFENIVRTDAKFPLKNYFSITNRYLKFQKQQ